MKPYGLRPIRDAEVEDQFYHTNDPAEVAQIEPQHERKMAAYQSGISCFCRGLTREQSPYPSGSQDDFLWACGFEAARDAQK
ncbi:MAG TPA: hypothetical protein VD994_12815 [Prosthecobacter sp.]|nr:hypothetical protein [Prosthecobacter sp.]